MAKISSALFPSETSVTSKTVVNLLATLEKKYKGENYREIRLLRDTLDYIKTVLDNKTVTYDVYTHNKILVNLNLLFEECKSYINVNSKYKVLNSNVFDVLIIELKVLAALEKLKGKGENKKIFIELINKRIESSKSMVDDPSYKTPISDTDYIDLELYLNNKGAIPLDILEDHELNTLFDKLKTLFEKKSLKYDDENVIVFVELNKLNKKLNNKYDDERFQKLLSDYVKSVKEDPIKIIKLTYDLINSKQLTLIDLKEFIYTIDNLKEMIEKLSIHELKILIYNSLLSVAELVELKNSGKLNSVNLLNLLNNLDDQRLYNILSNTMKLLSFDELLVLVEMRPSLSLKKIYSDTLLEYDLSLEKLLNLLKNKKISFENFKYIFTLNEEENVDSLKTLYIKDKISGYRDNKDEIIDNKISDLLMPYFNEKIENVQEITEETRNSFTDEDLQFIKKIYNSNRIFRLRVNTIKNDSYLVNAKKIYDELRSYDKRLGGRKVLSVKKEICGKLRCIYKIPGSRKEHIKYKRRLITVTEYKKLMKAKS